MPVPVASTAPVGQPGQLLEREPPALGGSVLDSSGARALTPCPRGPGCRPGRAAGCWRATRAPGAPTARPSARPTRRRRRRSAATRPRRPRRTASASRPAADATSTSSAAPGSSTCRGARAALRSRTPRPPLRRSAGRLRPSGPAAAPRGVRPRTPHPPRVRSTRRRRGRWSPARDHVDRLARWCVRRGGRGRPRRAARAAPPRGTEQPGRAAPRPAWRRRRARRWRAAAVPSPPWSSTWSSSARPPGTAPRPAGAATSGATASGDRRRPLTPAARSPRSASATPLSGRSPPGDSQTSARSTSRSTAAVAAEGSACHDRDQLVRVV